MGSQTPDGNGGSDSAIYAIYRDSDDGGSQMHIFAPQWGQATSTFGSESAARPWITFLAEKVLPQRLHAVKVNVALNAAAMATGRSTMTSLTDATDPPNEVTRLPIPAPVFVIISPTPEPLTVIRSAGPPPTRVTSRPMPFPVFCTMLPIPPSDTLISLPAGDDPPPDAMNSSCPLFQLRRSSTEYFLSSRSMIAAHSLQSHIPFDTSVLSSLLMLGSYLAWPPLAALICAASPRLTALSSSECGPLVDHLQAGFEHTCPARFARVSLVFCKKSGPSAIAEFPLKRLLPHVRACDVTPSNGSSPDW